MVTDATTVKTRLLILSDTHAVLPCCSDDGCGHGFKEPLSAADVAIHCGDLTMTGKIGEHKRALELLKSLNADVKIVIPGNHDLTLDRDYCRSHRYLYDWEEAHTAQDLKIARDLYTDEIAQESGIFYLEEGIQTFHLQNGAALTIYATAYTPEFKDWAFPYERGQDRYNNATASCPVPDYAPAGHANHIDVVVSHGPPRHVLDMTVTGEHAGCDHLAKAVTRCKPLLHCFGHIHEGWGAQIQTLQEQNSPVDNDTDETMPIQCPLSIHQGAAYVDATHLRSGSQCLSLNAAIMDIEYVPSQRPWLVDLQLPRRVQ